MIKTIIKRDGTSQEFNAQKINGWGEWASKTLGKYVDWSSVVLQTVGACPAECSSKLLQERLIKTCLDFKTWSYNRMAGRLYASLLYKDLYDNKIPTVKEVHTRLQKAGLMRKLNYSDKEYQEVNNMINHSLDLKEPHYAIHHTRKKYALKHKNKDEEFETLQFVFMRMAMDLAEDEPKEERMTHIFKWYSYFSQKKLNAPTPNYVNLGTEHKGFASCCLYKAGDSAKSLAIGDHIAYTMTYMSAGIGGYIESRSLHDSVRNGMTSHQGKLPYYRVVGKLVNANLQAGRGGACTMYYNVFDPEVETINQLKNPMSTEDRRIRDLDYAMQQNKFFARKVARNEKVFTFNVHTAPDLLAAMFKDSNEFEELYNKYEQDESFEKNYLSARDVMISLISESFETGRMYLAWMDEINRHTPHLDPIYQSNLCVVGETLVLTDEGYKEIATLVGQEVNIWNGEEWSKVTIMKTGKDKSVVRVVTNATKDIECTPNHKFYVVDGYRGRVVEKRAYQLEKGDKLIKFDLPLVEGHKTLNKAYENEFSQSTPLDSSYTVESRLRWLEGYLDSVGEVTGSRREASLQVTSDDTEFLYAVQLMLQELGIHSDVRTNESQSKTLSISSGSLYKLHLLGLKNNRWGVREPQCNAEQFIKIESVVNEGRVSDTYCFTEPKRNMGMFNGVLAGNCLEITQPTKEYQNIVDLYTTEDHGRGEVSMCSLAGILPANIVSEEEYEDVAYYALKMIDKCIHRSHYELPHTGMTAKARMNAGVGLIGVAHYMAKKHKMYSSDEGRKELNYLFEKHAYYCIRASLKLGKELGNAPWIHKTKWPQGWLPIDTYNKNVDSLVGTDLNYDWEQLRSEIIENGGIRNSSLIAHMPSESSSKASATTNGVYPIRSTYLVKTDKKNVIHWAAPDSEKLKRYYESAWDIQTTDMIDSYSIMQKWTDQTISADLWRRIPEGEMVKTSEMIGDYLRMTKMGMKTRYYVNTNTSNKQECEGCTL